MRRETHSGWLTGHQFDVDGQEADRGRGDARNAHGLGDRLWTNPGEPLDHFVRETGELRILELSGDGPVRGAGKAGVEALVRGEIALILNVRDDGRQLLAKRLLAEEWGEKRDELLGGQFGALGELGQGDGLVELNPGALMELSVPLAARTDGRASKVVTEGGFALLLGEE